MIGRLQRAFVLAVSLLPGLVPSVAASADDPAAALLAKHAAYVGWRGGDGSIKTLRESGEVTRDGKVIEGLSRLQMGQIYRVTGSQTANNLEGGFTGRIFWQSNGNGFTTPVNAEAVKYLATRDQIADEELTALAGTVRGTESVDGMTTTIVRVTAQAGLPVDLYIDPQTGAFARIVVDPDGRYETRLNGLAVSDVGNGKKVLSSWRYGTNPAVFTYTHIEANTEISNEELHPPKASASWTFGPPASMTPIAVTDKRIFFDATVNGHPGHFLFDTGAAGIAFTDSFARLAGATHWAQGRIRGIGGSATANLYSIDSLAIGASTLHNVLIFTGLDERVDNADRIDGAIGFDLLAGAIVDLDLDAQTIRILDPTLMAPDGTQGIALNIDLVTGQPRIAMTVGGRLPVDATLDSGDEFYALISSQLVSRGHAKFFSPRNSLAAHIRMRGVNGTEVDACGQLESLELGPISYRPVPACISEFTEFNEMLLGYDFFKNFNYVFDYPDGVMMLSRRKDR